MSELEAYFRTVYKPYGWMSDAQWRRLTETSTRRLPDGRVTPHYDPAMVMQFTHHPDDYRLWDAWDALDVPVLCLRGEDSDLVLRETVEQMRGARPARGGGRDRRLRPCAGAEHARAVGADRRAVRAGELSEPRRSLSPSRPRSTPPACRAASPARRVSPRSVASAMRLL